MTLPKKRHDVRDIIIIWSITFAAMGGLAALVMDTINENVAGAQSVETHK